MVSQGRDRAVIYYCVDFIFICFAFVIIAIWCLMIGLLVLGSIDMFPFISIHSLQFYYGENDSFFIILSFSSIVEGNGEVWRKLK